jgi:hypothetical protein
MEYVHLGKNAKSNVVHCPFNNSHTMPLKTLIMHLTRCPDKNSNFAVCHFNNLHVVKNSELADHEAQCPSRLQFDQMVYQTNENKIQVTLKGPETYDDLDETWDDQNSNQITPVQNVLKTINQTPCFMKPPVGCTKSERKQFRSEAQKVYSNVDLSYKPNSSLKDRIDSTTSNDGRNLNNVNQGNQQVKNNGLFFGKRPNT